jgi:hypothetical protein
MERVELIEDYLDDQIEKTREKIAAGQKVGNLNQNSTDAQIAEVAIVNAFWNTPGPCLS